MSDFSSFPTLGILGGGQLAWLAAAAPDRSLMYRGLPRKYGTQIVPDGVGHRLWDVDPATTDAERAAWNVPSHADVPSHAEMIRRAEVEMPFAGFDMAFISELVGRFCGGNQQWLNQRQTKSR